MKSLLLALLLALSIGKSKAETLFVATDYPHAVYVTNEPCELKEVANLPFKAMWIDMKEKKTYQGCIAINSELGIAVAYFTDRNVAVIPLYAFKSLTKL